DPRGEGLSRNSKHETRNFFNFLSCFCRTSPGSRVVGIERCSKEKTMPAVETPTLTHNVVSKEEWLKARKAHLAKEKEFTRLRDELSRQRRELPWEKVDKHYVFEGPNGKQTLGDLFEGRSQLIVYHFMLGPAWEHGCPSCSYLMDHTDGALVHLNARDVSF